MICQRMGELLQTGGYEEPADKDMDEWLRRRIRAIYWKQWKKVKTRYRMIRQYNLSDWKVHELANCRKWIWIVALMLNIILTNKENNPPRLYKPKELLRASM